MYLIFFEHKNTEIDEMKMLYVRLRIYKYVNILLMFFYQAYLDIKEKGRGPF